MEVYIYPLNPILYDTDIRFEVPSIRAQREFAYTLISFREFPEVLSLALKLHFRKPLSEVDMLWLKELAEAAGWSIEDVVDELENLHRDPSERVERYKVLFEKLYGEALNLVEKDTVQAAEKMWGAITALIKLHASLRRIPLIHWTHDKLYNYVANNVEREYREIFKNLLRAGEPLHRHFYEKGLDPEAFKEYWSDAVRLVEEARKIVFELMKQG